MPVKSFDCFIIGTGPTGQTVANALARAGRSVGVADYQAYGGTCPLRGCDPKKVLYGAARAMEAVERLKGKAFGARPPFSWADLQRWKGEFTEPVPAGTRQTFRENGIEQYHGRARFTAPHELTIGKDQRVRADHVVIATGATPAPLDLPGAGLLKTSDEFLDLPELPASLIIVGGGYIGTEFAHIAHTLGARVTLIATGDRLVEKFDPDLSRLLGEAATARGIDVRFSTEATRVERTQEGVRVHAETADGKAVTVTAAAAFHCAGRVPNVADLGLGAAGIGYGDRGITVNDALCTSVRAHYAVGDCADSGLPLTPVGNHEAQLLLDNLLSNARRTLNYYPIPTVAFTLPPIASVGMTAAEAAASDQDLTLRQEETTGWFSNRHRNARTAGYKLIVDTASGRLLGAHLLGPDAAEVINLFTLAIRQGLTVSRLRHLIWAYPTSGADLSSMLPEPGD